MTDTNHRVSSPLESAHEEGLRDLIVRAIKANGYVAPNGHWYLRVTPETIGDVVVTLKAREASR